MELMLAAVAQFFSVWWVLLDAHQYGEAFMLVYVRPCWGLWSRNESKGENAFFR